MKDADKRQTDKKQRVMKKGIDPSCTCPKEMECQSETEWDAEDELALQEFIAAEEAILAAMPDDPHELSWIGGAIQGALKVILDRIARVFVGIVKHFYEELIRLANSIRPLL